MYLIDIAKLLFKGSTTVAEKPVFQLNSKDVITLHEAVLQTKDMTQILLIMADSMGKAKLRTDYPNTTSDWQRWQRTLSNTQATFAKLKTEYEYKICEYVKIANMLDMFAKKVHSCARDYTDPDFEGNFSSHILSNFNRAYGLLQENWDVFDVYNSSAFDIPRMDEVKERMIPVKQAAAEFTPKLTAIVE
ncbi:MAG: hypothetical protein AAB276_07620, partial [Pseudomonadota bacterium]